MRYLFCTCIIIAITSYFGKQILEEQNFYRIYQKICKRPA